ncbi:macro domain-containing protein [Capnocytophaga canis]|uniref:macro domain-containing protein n=1 Tax=Capnocytophaga canis TaxID=1848903 RepID=UPI0037D31CE1
MNKSVFIEKIKIFLSFFWESILPPMAISTALYQSIIILPFAFVENKEVILYMKMAITLVCSIVIVTRLINYLSNKIAIKTKSGIIIEINTKRLWNNDCDIAIPSAECFDTDYSNVIGKNTSMASVIKMAFNENSLELDNLIDNFIQERNLIGEPYTEKQLGKKIKYPFGTTLRIRYNNRNIFITSMAKINPEGGVSVTFESMMLGLLGLWNSVRGSRSNLTIALPVWGGGNGMSGISKVNLIQLIILSFIWENKKEIAKKIIISGSIP